jgi:hypothetical protein
MLYRVLGTLSILVGCFLTLGDLLRGDGPPPVFRSHDSGTGNMVNGLALLAAGPYLCVKCSFKKA